MIWVGIMQFGMGFLVVFMRLTESQLCKRCVHRCIQNVQRCMWYLSCCGCCGLCKCCQRASVDGVSTANLFRRWPACLKLRWYWFIISAQAGFIAREYVVITKLNGWEWEVVTAHSGLGAVFMITCREVWQFSSVRDKSKRAFNQVLDMLILPLNYGFTCALCVRVLRLQDTPNNRMLAMALLDSADVWESFALWSVLKLFVWVVEAQYPVQEAMAHRHRVEDILKKISRQVVMAWIVVLVLASSVEIIWKGFIVQRMPTFCPLLYGSCIECGAWYDQTIFPLKAAIVYIVSSLAIIFVFYFERAFADTLESIEPYWKFFGVKCVVTVTYLQYILIKYLTSYNESLTYMYHCLACCMELPLLAIMHCFFAYPFGRTWITVLLQCSARMSRTITLDFDDRTLQDSTPTPLTSLLLYAVLAPAWCFAAFRFLIWAAPPEMDVHSMTQRPFYTWTCSSEDLGLFVQGQADKHLVLPPDAGKRFRIDRVAGVWLPRCAEQALACGKGYLGAPSVSCNSQGVYDIHGGCKAVVCGRPPWVENAVPQRWDAEQNENVLYTCKTGYRGSPKAVCGVDGEYILEGFCENITALTCGDPPLLDFASPVADSDHARSVRKAGPWPKSDETDPAPADAKRTWTVGAEVKYRCNEGYFGSMTLKCAASGAWSEQEGGCRKLCGPLPHVLHAYAVPELGAEQIDGNVLLSGAEVVYHCRSGFVGSVLAVCNAQGLWDFPVGRTCSSHSCETLGRFLNRTSVADGQAIAWMDRMRPLEPLNLTSSENSEGDVIQFRCRPGFTGRPTCICTHHDWLMLEPCQLFNTRRGCRCKSEWIHCKGWFGSSCQKFHGCLSAPEGWCYVDRGSCPASYSSLSWDYCSVGEPNTTEFAAPEPVKDRGVNRDECTILVASLVASFAVVVACVCFSVALISRCRSPPRKNGEAGTVNLCLDDPLVGNCSEVELADMRMSGGSQ